MANKTRLKRIEREQYAKLIKKRRMFVYEEGAEMGRCDGKKMTRAEFEKTKTGSDVYLVIVRGKRE